MIWLADLTTADRCDGCSSQAWVRAWIGEEGRELLFCGHHFHQHEGRLTALGAVWDDQTHRINATLDASPA